MSEQKIKLPSVRNEDSKKDKVETEKANKVLQFFPTDTSQN